MSKHNNVNPDFYKTGGREHTDGADKGEYIEDDKQRLTQSQKDVDHPAVKRAKKK